MPKIVKNAFTTVGVRSLIDQGKPAKVADGGGLYLHITGPGVARWCFRFMIDKNAKEMGLGAAARTEGAAASGVTLKEARTRALAAQAKIAAGIDPIADQHAARAATLAAAAPPPAPEPGRTLRDALNAHLAAHAPGWRGGKTEKLCRAMMDNHAAELLGKHVAEIATQDVSDTLAPLWERGGKVETATKLRTRLEAVLEWAIAAGWRAGPNPAVWRGGLRPLLARPDSIRETRHHPALAWERVPDFVAALADENGGAPRALHLAVLTAARSGEVRGADWSEIDLAAALWTIPAARMKSKREHRIPLSPPALALVRSMLPQGGSKPAAGLLFPNPKGVPYSDMALLAVVKRMDAADRRADGPGWRDRAGERIAPHGFRSAFRMWCGDHGHDRDLAEMALAHTVGDETERAYARSDLLARRRTLMDAWGAWCARAAAVPAAIGREGEVADGGRALLRVVA